GLAVGNAEDDVHRVGLRDGGEKHVGARYKRAFRNRRAAGYTRDRRFDPRPVEIEPRLVNAGAGALHLRLGHLVGGLGVVELLLAHRLRLEYGLQPRDLALRLRELRLGHGKVTLGAGEGGLERRRVDGEERLPLLHGGALAVVAFQQYSGHARPHFDLAEACCLRRVFVVDRYILRLDRDDGDDRRWESPPPPVARPGGARPGPRAREA